MKFQSKQCGPVGQTPRQLKTGDLVRIATHAKAPYGNSSDEKIRKAHREVIDTGDIGVILYLDSTGGRVMFPRLAASAINTGSYCTLVIPVNELVFAQPGECLELIAE